MNTSRMRGLASSLQGLSVDLDDPADADIARQGAEYLRTAADEIERLNRIIDDCDAEIKAYRAGADLSTNLEARL